MDSAIFKANLRVLLASRGITQKGLADTIGGESTAERHSYYRWLRRTCSQGLTRCEDRNRRQLQRLCDFFGIHPVERLWSRGLTQSQKQADEYADMLRFILQTTASPDGCGTYPIDGVNGYWLTQKIRQMYEVLVPQSEQLSERIRWDQHTASKEDSDRQRRHRDVLVDVLSSAILDELRSVGTESLTLEGPAKSREVILSIFKQQPTTPEMLAGEDHIWKRIRDEYSIIRQWSPHLGAVLYCIQWDHPRIYSALLTMGKRNKVLLSIVSALLSQGATIRDVSECVIFLLKEATTLRSD